MITKLGHVSSRVLLIAMSAGCATAISVAAWAAPPPSPPASGQTIEGCDQRVLDAAQEKARSLVVYDKAVSDEEIDKPDSQLALDCFNNIAGIDEKEGGSLFSGDLNGHWWSSGYTYPYNKSTPPTWTSDTYYTDDIEDALNGFYDDFADAEGNDGGTVDYTQTTVTDSPNCTEEQDLWGDPPGGTPTPGPGDERGQGEQGGIPFYDDDALTNTTALTNGGSQGADFNNEMNTLDQADLTSYDTALKKLVNNPPVPGTDVMPVTPVFTDGTVAAGQNNSCTVLQTAGVAASCP
jgi:hypothetical protein